jgi:hypothetical protein
LRSRTSPDAVRTVPVSDAQRPGTYRPHTLRWHAERCARLRPPVKPVSTAPLQSGRETRHVGVDDVDHGPDSGMEHRPAEPLCVLCVYTTVRVAIGRPLRGTGGPPVRWFVIVSISYSTPRTDRIVVSHLFHIRHDSHATQCGDGPSHPTQMHGVPCASACLSACLSDKIRSADWWVSQTTRLACYAMPRCWAPHTQHKCTVCGDDETPL